MSEDLLQEAHLRYTTDSIPGFSRKKRGEHFQYFDTKGEKIDDEKVILRINSLAIPPAWEHVWICRYANGHLQATGIDSKGRKQYRYHPLWTEVSQQKKFEHMVQFAQVLPLIRTKVENGLRRKNLDREKVLATVIWLLENTLIRVGNEEYEKENKSYGLTTLKNKHATVRGSQVKFSFKGKSGVYHDVKVDSKKVARIIKQVQELPGQQLFEYIDEEKNRQIVDSQDVNEYLKSITGQDITAKDFRTWAGTMLAAQWLDTVGVVDTETGKKKNISEIVKKVSKHLRNLPSTCRKYYIHPAIFDAYTQSYTLSNLDTHNEYRKAMKVNDLHGYENGVIGLLSLFA